MKNVVSKSNFALYLLHRKIKNSLLKGPNQTENWWIQDQTGMALKEINPITVFCHLVAYPSYLYWNCLDFLCLLSSLVWLWFSEIWFFFFSFIKFMFSKKATNIWRNLQFMEIFYFYGYDGLQPKMTHPKY